MTGRLSNTLDYTVKGGGFDSGSDVFQCFLYNSSCICFSGVTTICCALQDHCIHLLGFVTLLVKITIVMVNFKKNKDWIFSDTIFTVL